MTQDALFDLPARPAKPRRSRRRFELPPGVPWLDQYPIPRGVSDEERRRLNEQSRQEADDCLRWWAAYHDELVRRAGGESRCLQDCYDMGMTPDPEREEHARRYARAQRDPLRAMTMGSVPELDAIRPLSGA